MSTLTPEEGFLLDVLHWHAYAWTGPAEDREPGEHAPGQEGDYWLRRPASVIRATFTTPEAAEAWMRAEAAAYPAELEADSAHSLLYLRQFLHDEPYRTPSLFYRDRFERLVRRYLVPCPRPAVSHYPKHKPPPCPLGRGRA
ncbi:hypothetical protein [Streptomyces sp. G1]|uniref:hypothetical protein n=1 Tax=Streptomyces sp. G1 TaxID=361572 RepID=UPI00202F57AE|nr:hypothetical protein [Streptomyces sp. G1]MCM1964816.1 hypothetical protein [Streptomyces sp. G1]